jgi:hypothetical protein
MVVNLKTAKALGLASAPNGKIDRIFSFNRNNKFECANSLAFVYRTQSKRLAGWQQGCAARPTRVSAQFESCSMGLRQTG